MELDGKVYYARLTVKQGTTGYTSQPVKASETYTIYIGSLGENKVNAVTFNGEDVTDEIKNGYYTTPEIKGESELSISYVSGTALNSVVNNNTRVTGYDGEIRITNIDSPSDIFVYTVDGQLVGNITSAFGNATTKNMGTEKMITFSVPYYYPIIIRDSSFAYTWLINQYIYSYISIVFSFPSVCNVWRSRPKSFMI